jgi:glyoxylase-like metal-dependent hydrolase (beta-lactamase superfamily II)
MPTFTQFADRVFVFAYPVLKVNCTLVVGDDRALLVDTLATAAQAGELAEAVRALTDRPLVLANTHLHYDHTFGNATLAGPDTEIWATEPCARQLRERGAHWQRHWQQEVTGFDADLAHAVGRVELRAPDHVVHSSTELDLGGVTATLTAAGRGHTDGDLVVRVGELVVAGDLIESGDPLDFTDSYPLDWPETLAAVEALGSLFVPGHGAVMSAEQVREQHDELTRLDWLIREAHADDVDPRRVARATELARWGDNGLVQALHAVRRGYGQLDARIPPMS